MSDFELTLDDCLAQIASGASSLDECLARYPEHAALLKPLLQTAALVERGQTVVPSPAFKSRMRAQLYAHMDAHPRRRAWTFSPVWRVAVSLAVLIAVFLVTGTAFAQGALPGQTLYAWKLSSEQVWRAVSPDPVGVDLSLAERRVDEATIVAASPERKAQALNGYLEVLARLKSEEEAGNKERILSVLKSHRAKLSAAGISIPELDQLVAPASGSSPIIPPVVPMPSLLPAPVPSRLPVPKVIPSLPPVLIPPIAVPTLPATILSP